MVLTEGDGVDGRSNAIHRRHARLIATARARRCTIRVATPSVLSILHAVCRRDCVRTKKKILSTAIEIIHHFEYNNV